MNLATLWNAWTGLGLGIIIGLVLGVAAVLLPTGRELAAERDA